MTEESLLVKDRRRDLLLAFLSSEHSSEQPQQVGILTLNLLGWSILKDKEEEKN